MIQNMTASSDQTRRSAQAIFNFMEKDTMPKSTTNKESTKQKDLNALIKKNVRMNNEKDRLLESLGEYILQDDADGKGISEKFKLVCSFSFFE